MHRLVYVTYLLMVASAGVTFVFLEDVETLYGISSFGIGLISSLSFISGVVASVFLAPLGDRGHLRTLAVLAFVSAIAGNLWIGFATELWSLSVSRGLAGLGTGMFSVVGRKALIGETAEDGAEMVGGFISAAVAGFLLGPALGAILGEIGGIETPYLTIAGALILVSVPMVRWLDSVPVAVADRVRSSEMLGLLRRPAVRAASAAHIAVFFNIGVFDATVDELLTDLGASNQRVALILLIVGSPLLFIPRLAGKRIDQAAQPSLIMLGAFALFIPIVLTLGLWVSTIVFIVFATTQTVMESVLFPASTRVILDETGAERSAIGTGLLDALGGTAGGFSAFIAPTLFDLTDGPLGSFGTSGLVAGGLFALAVLSLRRQNDRVASKV